MPEPARQLRTACLRFLRDERGVETVEWVTLAILMGSIILYFSRDLVSAILTDLLDALAGATPR
ncbi:MAG: hypothetical protein VX726_08400 [Planctomycetota bacterium]|nr:hypothetical protein [Planctomycetota bacterium]